MSQRQFKLDTMLYRLYKKPDKDLFFYGNNHLIALWELQQQISMVTSLSNSTIDKKCDFTVSRVERKSQERLKEKMNNNLPTKPLKELFSIYICLEKINIF